MAVALTQFERTVMNMMRRYSGPGTFVSVSEGVYDPAISKKAKTETSYPVRIITFDYTQKTEGTSTETGTLTEQATKQVYMEPAAGMPSPRPKVDKLVYNGKTYSVASIKEFNPNGVKTLFFELYIRR